jgi:hypothetical protein
MQFVAAAEVNRWFVLRCMEGASVIKLHVTFELSSEVVANDEPGDPSVGRLVDLLISDLEVHVNGAEFPGEFERQQKRFARRSNSAADSVIGVVEKKLGKSRNRQALLAPIIKRI